MLWLAAIAVRPWGKAIDVCVRVNHNQMSQDQIMRKSEGVRMTSDLIIVRVVFYHAKCLFNISDGLRFVGCRVSGHTDCADGS